MKIRKAVLSDAAVVAEFNTKLALESEHIRLNPKVVSQGVRALLKDAAKGTYFVAETADGEVAGQLMITQEWSDWRNGNYWWIQSVYVREEFRGQGVFKELYGYVTRLARKQKNIRGLRLYVEKQNERALRAYVKLGMKETYYRIFEKKT